MIFNYKFFLKNIKENKIILIILGLIAALLISGIVVYLKVNKNQKSSVKKAIQEQKEVQRRYNYQNIVYNFWGTIVDKEKDFILVEGVNPESVIPKGEQKANPEENTLETIKFRVNEKTKIVKAEKGQQVFIDFSAIQKGDRVGLKSGQIGLETKEILAEDILLLPPISAPAKEATSSPLNPLNK